jgi:hypothetical protein
MMGYYARYPAISQQNLATLFPFLTDIKDHWPKPTQHHRSRAQHEDPPKHPQGDLAKSTTNGTKNRD